MVGGVFEIALAKMRDLLGCASVWGGWEGVRQAARDHKTIETAVTYHIISVYQRLGSPTVPVLLLYHISDCPTIQI